ncbi:MAG: septum formation initiator family protein [Clostridia bacterium]|nr:septum formation initiator family protein [Clostridia bacterium]
MKGKKTEEKNERMRSRLFVIALVVILAIGSVNLVGQLSKLSDKKKEVSVLQAEIEEQKKKIEEDEYLLDKDNELEYIERIAREKYGYAAPGERAFYVSDGG